METGRHPASQRVSNPDKILTAERTGAHSCLPRPSTRLTGLGLIPAPRTSILCRQDQTCTFSPMLPSFVSTGTPQAAISKRRVSSGRQTRPIASTRLPSTRRLSLYVLLTLHTHILLITSPKSGGVVGSPHIMLLSGVGPSSVLKAAGIDVVLDLPGVGQNVQDHVGNGINWATTEATMPTIENSNSDFSKTAEWLSFISDAIAYVNLTTLMGDNMSTWISTVQNGYTTSEGYIPSTDSTILAGYKSTFDVITQTYYPSAVPQVEILLSLNAANTVTIQAALQHPLSRGQITVNSTSAFDTPVIDPGYFSHWADRDILRAAFKLVRNIAAAQPIAQYLGTESSPGTSVSSDDDLNTWMNGGVHTDYHPLGSMSMLPKSLGGVVDKYCLVYGTCESHFPIILPSY